MPEEKEVVRPAVAIRRAAQNGEQAAPVVVSQEQVNEVVEKAVEQSLEDLVKGKASAGIGSTASSEVVSPAPVAPVAPPAPPVAPVVPPAPPVKPSVPQPKYHFVKNFTPAQPVRFKDGTSYTFRLIPLNTGGNQHSSFVKTDDEKLAENLREAAKNPALGIVEITK